MKTIINVCLIAFGCFFAWGCRASQVNGPESAASSSIETDTPVAAPSPAILKGEIRAMRKAVIYRANGDYSHNVAACFNDETGDFIYYPDPSDVNPESAPIRLADGWWLDVQGAAGYNTVFLKWTYDQYCRLKEVPSLSQLKQAIIKGAKVTDVKVLNMTPLNARNDTAAINAAILHLPGSDPALILN